MSNRSWVTLATNDSYGLGALVLAHSLRRAGSIYPATVLITPSVTEAMRERLRAVFAEVVTVDVLDSRDAAHLALLQRPELGITFTKIHCWNLTQYEKCVFLDADTLIVQNCDELFEREELSAAPDVGWPDCFNSGVFVFKPSAETFDSLVKFAQERGSFDGGDQGLLNSFFSDWAHGDISKHLPFLYNVTSAAFYSYLPALKHYGQNLKIIHFIGAAKPWLQQFNWESRHVDAPEHLREFLQLWWDLFVSQVHSQLDISMVEVEVQHQENVDNPPVLPPQDVNQHFHYQPILDPESEFPWHRPETQIHGETYVPQIDMSDFHDPWDIYQGHIPPISDETTSYRSDTGVEATEDVRKYVWEYQAPQYTQDNGPQSVEQPHFEYSHNDSQPHSGNYNEPVYIQDQNAQYHWHNFQYEQNQYSENNNEKQKEQSTYNYYEPAHWRQEQSYPEYPKHDTIYNPNVEHCDNQHSNEHSVHTYLSHDQSHHTQEIHSQDTQEFHDLHKNNHHSHFNETYTSHKISSHQHSYQSDQTSQSGVQKCNNHDETSYHGQQVAQQEIEVRQVHIEHEKNIEQQTKDVIINGDISDSESEIEDIRPRHPYDGYYLRHRMTIDSRGRKICTHEIPPPPSPSPSESPTPQDYFSAEETPSDCEDQSGVAGNLARVAIGGGQREAIDDLTRRQGWEAGNIDYMGADAFENIWAKISQTLSQPRQSPSKQSPPREPQPAPQPAASEPVSQEIEVAKEALPIEPPVVPAELPAPAVDVPVVPSQIEAPVQDVVAKAAVPAEPAPPAVVDAPAAIEVSSPVAVPEVIPEVVAAAEKAVSSEPEVKPAAPEVPAAVIPAAPIEVPESEVPVPVEAIEQISVPKESESKKTEAVEIKSSPAEAVAAAPKAPESVTATPASPTSAEAAGSPAVPEATPEKAPVADTTSDSPPLANTPSKEEAPVVPAAKSTEEAAQETRL